MGSDGVVSAGDSIQGLLNQYHRAAQGDQQTHGTSAAVHRQKFQSTPSSKLRSAVERGVNPFRLACDALVDESQARQRAKQRRAKRSERAAVKRGNKARSAVPHSLSPLDAVPPRAAREVTGATLATKSAEKPKKNKKLTPQQVDGTSSETRKKPLAFNTHELRTGAGAVPLALQTRHKELGLGERPTSATSKRRNVEPVPAITRSLQVTADQNIEALQRSKQEARRDRRVWSRPCTAEHVRRSHVGVGLPHRLSHVVRVVPRLSTAHADQTTLLKWDRRRRRAVRDAARQHDRATTPPTLTVAELSKNYWISKKRTSRKARFRTLVWETIQHSDSHSWSVASSLLRERRRFLDPLSTQYPTETLGLTAARSFPLFGALVEVLDVDVDTTVPLTLVSRRGAVPLIHQRQRRIGLVLAESQKTVVVLLLPSPCEADQHVLDAFAQFLTRDTTEVGASPPPPCVPAPFETIKVPKLFAGGSGDLLDVLRHHLAFGTPTGNGRHRALLCVYLGELQQSPGTTSILSPLKGRCL